MSEQELRRRLARAESAAGPARRQPTVDEVVKRFKSGGFDRVDADFAFEVVRLPMRASVVLRAAAHRIREHAGVKPDPVEILADLFAYPPGTGDAAQARVQWLLEQDGAPWAPRKQIPPQLDAMTALAYRFWHREDHAEIERDVAALCQGEVVWFLLPFGAPYRDAERISNAMLLPEKVAITNADRIGPQEVDNSGHTWSYLPATR